MFSLCLFQLGNCVEIGIPMLLLVIGLSQVSCFILWLGLMPYILSKIPFLHTRMNCDKMQYLKHVRPFRDVPIFERFPVLICVTIVWIYSLILTASGAYRDKPGRTQVSCRTDRANLISSAPWYMKEELTSICSAFYVIRKTQTLNYFRFKFPYPLQWGPPTFSAGHSFAMMSAVLVSMVEVCSQILTVAHNCYLLICYIFFISN